MPKQWLAFFIISNLLFCRVVYALPVDEYLFSTASQRARFDNLTQQFRCLVCQNETLADSNAPLARDLRGQIAAMVQRGASDIQIKDYLTQRYGDYILFRPRLTALTYFLWIGPFGLLIVGLSILFIIVYKRQQRLHNQ